MSKHGGGPRVVVQQTGFLGDAILATALVKEARNTLGASEVGMIVRASYGDLFDDQPAIDRLFRLEKRNRTERRGVIEEIRSRKYDVILSPHRSFSSALLGQVAHISRRVGFRVADGAFLYTDRVEYRNGMAEYLRNRELLEPFAGGGLPPEKPEIVVTGADTDLATDTRRGVGLFYGSVWATKQWGVRKYTELAARLRESGIGEIFLLGSPAEREEGEEIRHAAGLPTRALLAGDLTLPDLARFLSHLQLVVTNDSGGLHLSEAVGTPVIAIFGPTIPAFGFSPWREDSILADGGERPCRPCGIHGAPVCPLRHHACMESVSVDRIVRLVTDRLVTVD